MTIAATGIGRWPREKWEVKPCRGCQVDFLGTRKEKYCVHPVCQAERRRREREHARERERRRKR